MEIKEGVKGEPLRTFVAFPAGTKKRRGAVPCLFDGIILPQFFSQRFPESLKKSFICPIVIPSQYALLDSQAKGKRPMGKPLKRGGEIMDDAILLILLIILVRELNRKR